jgi:hypothetical protein
MRSAYLALALAMGVMLGVDASPASAQYGPVYRPGLYPQGTPGLSPYLDLTRGGNLAANYFLGTIPEIERRRNTALFGAAIQDLERRSLALEQTQGADELVPTLPGTGHPVAFGSYQPYYSLGVTGTATTRAQQQTPPARRR